MKENVLYYIWLQHVLGFGSAKIRTVLRFYKTPEDFYRTSIGEKRMLGCFTKSELNAFEKFSLENCQSVIDRCERLHYNIITLANPQYPQRLKEIYNPPCVLYCQGELPDSIRTQMKFPFIICLCQTMAVQRHQFHNIPQ